MSNLYIDLANIGASCLILIFIGYMLTKLKLITAEDFRSINKVYTDFSLPFLIFRAIASKNIKDMQFQSMLNGLLTLLSVLLLSCLLFLIPVKDRLHLYLCNTLSYCFVNYIIVGVPVILSIWGEDYLHLPPMLSLVQNTVFTPFFTVTVKLWSIREEKRRSMTHNNDDPQQSLGSADKIDDPGHNDSLVSGNETDEAESHQVKVRLTLMDILLAFYATLKAPQVIGLIFGVIYCASGLEYPYFLSKLGLFCGDVIVVTALISTGNFIAMRSLFSCKWYQLLFSLFVRIIVFPAFSLLYSIIFKLESVLARQCLVLAMLPTANNAFVYATQFRIGVDIATGIIFWSLFTIIPSIVIWFMFLDNFNIFVVNDEEQNENS